MSSTENFEAVAEGIAIVGMSGRFPGARDVHEFWQNLRDGAESITFFTDEELLAAGVEPSALSASNYIKARGMLAGVEEFDAAFFGISPREAEIIDPQQRLFLECAWESLENAGYDPETYPGRIGVYAGVSLNTYLLTNICSNPDLIASVGDFQIMLGNDRDYLPTRVSYKLNLKGPSLTVQTACSTSLVAVHLACQSLMSYQCDMALAGGASATSEQKAGYFFQEGGIASPDGHCRAFDAKARGTVSGSGVGIVVLKRLEDALADGDCIMAVIKGSAINNDGALKIGYTAPSAQGQAEVIAEAQAVAGVKPETITYIEAHGTGTALGDPIEISALSQVFRATTEKKGFCAVGSVKTNIGHLDAAAGVTSLIKTALALKYKQIPPSLFFQEPNPQIDFANSPFYVNAELAEWKSAGTSRRAGVSSFGIGGTNAHVILEESPALEETSPSRSSQLIVLSAKTSAALEAATANLARYLKRRPELNLADVAYTLQIGRRAFGHRRLVVCENLEMAIDALESSEVGRGMTQFHTERERPVVFMFPGQGAQYVNMGSELYRSERVFREQVDKCARLLLPRLDFDLRTVLYPQDERQIAEATQRLQQTSITQPALFVIEYALAQLWLQWGVRPQAMLGHSVGEYVAACLAGVFSLEEALELVSVRGRLMQQQPGGAMLAVSLSERELQPLLDERLSLAAVNGPSQCVVAGPVDAVDEMERRLSAKGLSCRRLQTSHAFHSHMMNPMLELFAGHVKKINLSTPQIPYISNLTGRWITAAEATDPAYWVRHLRETVRFGDSLSELFTKPEMILLEVGPGRTLSALAKQRHDKTGAQVVLSTLPQAQQRGTDVHCLLSTLGRLWLEGAQVNWNSFYGDEKRLRVHLPTYPFERQRYWIEQQAQTAEHKPLQERLYKKPDLSDWFYAPTWKQSAQQLVFAPDDNTTEEHRWLVLCDAVGLGAQLVERLQQSGRRVVSVRAGARFARLDDGGYVVNALRREDYDSLFEELRKKGEVPGKILHLWNVTPDAEDSANEATLGEAQPQSFYSLLYLAQAIADQGITDPIQISVISNNMQAVTGTERLSPLKAALLGPCRVIRNESPNLSCRSIDLVLPAPATWQEEELIERLMAEINAEMPEMVVAYRSARRWTQTFEPVRIEGASALPGRLRERGVYLITGGLGGVGFELAQYLARAVRARLVLTGRSYFPGSDEWRQWLASHDEQGEVSRKIRQLQELEAAGAEILVLRADVTDRAQMQAVFDQTQEHFGQVHGIIHAAGVAGGGLIQLQTDETTDAVLAPKVRGTQTLEAALKNHRPDFLALCSSQVSLLGGVGRVEYCAANAFLDAFASYYRARYGTFSVSINWDTWKEVGMAAREAARLNLNVDETMPEGMLSQEGVEVFSRILRGQLSQVIVSTQDFNALVERSKTFTASSSLKEVEQTRLSQPAHPRPQLSTPYVAPGNEVEQTIADIWQTLLGIDGVGINDNFFELGGDSVVSIQVIARVNQAGLRLTPRQVFEYPTIAELAAVAGVAKAIHAEQEAVTGTLPLTPIQQWFFEQEFPEPHHYNQEVLFEVRQTLRPSLLERAVRQLLVHHDALRLRFTQEQGSWKQENFAPDDAVPFVQVDLSTLPESEQSGAIEAKVAELQASLNISDGPSLRVALFNLGAERPARLLIVVHHLAMDGVSWRVLLEDLETAYQQLNRGEAISLPAKTTSFKQWSERLADYAQSESLRQELAHWESIRASQSIALPLDLPDGVNTVASARTVEISLNAEETRALLQDVPQTYRTQINDALLTALAQAFASWTGSRNLLIDLEGHGREAIFEDVDLSRTVGWFTTIFPVLLDLQKSSGPGEALKAIKEQLRAIPNNGFGFGLLRYLHHDAEVAERLQSLPQAEANFLYLGQFNLLGAESSSLFGAARESSGPSRSPWGRRKHLLEITAAVIDGTLQTNWIYSEEIHLRETIESLAKHFVEALRALINHCQTSSGVGYTPSDFAEFGWSQGDLDDILAKISDASNPA
jgi:non-ribosomal peptide synthase protein (TIGR01720 family)